MERETARALGCDSVEELEALLDGDDDAFLGLDSLDGIVVPDSGPRPPVWCDDGVPDEDEPPMYEIL
eukprot:4424384-Prymnesium_polylepis.2